MHLIPLDNNPCSRETDKVYTCFILQLDTCLLHNRKCFKMMKPVVDSTMDQNKCCCTLREPRQPVKLNYNCSCAHKDTVIVNLPSDVCTMSNKLSSSH